MVSNDSSNQPGIGCNRCNCLSSSAGMAHMLEHEAFKGSERIGTTDWSKEAPLLDAQDEGTPATLNPKP